MAGGRLWTTAEDEHLAREYPHADLDSISTAIGRTRKAIHQRASKLGLPRKNPRDWPDADVEFLRRNYPAMPTRDVVEHLGRPYESVRMMAQRHGICKERRFYWYTVNSGAFDLLSPDTAYVVGMILADGCVHDAARFSIASTDKEILGLIGKTLGTTRPVSVYYSPPHKPGYTLHINDRRMVTALADLGITPRKSLTARMPAVPDEYFFDFLRGYFDGDGNAHGDDRRLTLTFVSGSQGLLTDISQAVARHLVHDPRTVRPHANRRGYLLKYHGPAALEVGDRMYQRAGALYIPRKRAPFDVYRNLPWPPLRFPLLHLGPVLVLKPVPGHPLS